MEQPTKLDLAKKGSSAARLAVDVESRHAAKLPYYTPGDVISLHLGYPDPRTFPAQEIAEATTTVLNEDYQKALQYCEEQGDAVLRTVLANTYQHLPKAVTSSNIIITQGTTDAIEILAQLLLSPGDIVFMESPTYLWAIRSFQFRRARMIGVPADTSGIRTDLLRERLPELIKSGAPLKFLYVMPDFQNPSGHSMSMQRRIELLDIAAEYELLIVEDSPYLGLRYEGEQLPTLFEMDDRNLVVLAQTFSKSVGPGIRLGWVVGPEAFINKLVKVKQTGACTLLSRSVAHYLQTSAYLQRMEHARQLYRAKRDAMANSLSEHCPESVTWRQPEGGFYFWLNLPLNINAQTVCDKAAASKLFLLNGENFFCDETRWNSLRLSFSYESEENISRGITLLGKILHESTI